jgi:hypothetical protein
LWWSRAKVVWEERSYELDFRCGARRFGRVDDAERQGRAAGRARRRCILCRVVVPSQIDDPDDDLRKRRLVQSEDTPNGSQSVDEARREQVDLVCAVGTRTVAKLDRPASANRPGVRRRAHAGLCDPGARVGIVEAVAHHLGTGAWTMPDRQVRRG